MLKATHFEYRFRYPLHVALYFLGFLAPWNYALHLDPSGPNAHLWGGMAADLSRLGVGNIATAFDVLLVLGILFAFAGAFLRTWGSAFLGSNIVQSGTMHTAQASPVVGLIEDGPFRHLRNPLYLGTFLHTLALALLMPASGAVFTIVLIGLLQIRLILAEEPYLSEQLGSSYAAYCALVPRIVPALKPRIAAAGMKPHWPQAFVGEIYFWGVAGSFAFAGWGYNTQPLLKCVLVSFGLSLVATAFAPKPQMA